MFFSIAPYPPTKFCNRMNDDADYHSGAQDKKSNTDTYLGFLWDVNKCPRQKRGRDTNNNAQYQYRRKRSQRPLNDHHKLLIISIPRFSQNEPEITHYEIDQPLRGVPFKRPRSQAADCKCRNIMNENFYPLIGHYQSSLKHQQDAEHDNRSYATAGHHQAPDEKQNIQHNLPPEKKEVNERRQSADSDYQAGNYKDHRRQFCKAKIAKNFHFYHLSKRSSQIRKVRPQTKKQSRASSATAKIMNGKFIKIPTTPQSSAIARTRLTITFMASIIRLLLSYFLSILYHKNIFMSSTGIVIEILFLIL